MLKMLLCKQCHSEGETLWQRVRAPALCISSHASEASKRVMCSLGTHKTLRQPLWPHTSLTTYVAYWAFDSIFPMRFVRMYSRSTNPFKDALV